MSGIESFCARRADGQEVALADFAGQVLLVVNVASRCGFTPQYAALEAIHREFHPFGFSVLAFPCNQFGGQEPGTDAEIAEFCDLNYEVTFPVFSRVAVNGPGAHPLFCWLKRQKSGLLTNAIKWNFTKFLIGRDGSVLAREAPTTNPLKMRPMIARALR